MNNDKRKNLEAKDWKFGNVDDLLNIEYSDIGRDLDRFPHGWWIAPMLMAEILTVIIILLIIYL